MSLKVPTEIGMCVCVKTNLCPEFVEQLLLLAPHPLVSAESAWKQKQRIKIRPWAKLVQHWQINYPFKLTFFQRQQERPATEPGTRPPPPPATARRVGKEPGRIWSTLKGKFPRGHGRRLVSLGQTAAEPCPQSKHLLRNQHKRNFIRTIKRLICQEPKPSFNPAQLKIWWRWIDKRAGMCEGLEEPPWDYHAKLSTTKPA